MESPILNDVFVSCQACYTKNSSNASNCSHCQADLLPGRPLGVRLLFGGISIIGLGIPLAMWIFSNAIPSGLLLICVVIPMMTVRFTGAFTRTPLAERLTRRANRHLTLSLSQSIIDYTNALKVATDDVTCCGLFEQRGETFMKLGRLQNAFLDFQACVETPEPNRRQLSQSAAYGLWKNHSTKACSKMDEIKRNNPHIVAEVSDM
jgi:hypothetical protein